MEKLIDTGLVIEYKLVEYFDTLILPDDYDSTADRLLNLESVARKGTPRGSVVLEITHWNDPF